MKIKILLILLCLSFSYSMIASEIKLIPDKNVETDINYESPEREKLMQSSPEKLHNNGVILQNSITPIKGLNYPSNKEVLLLQNNETPPEDRKD